MRTEQLETVRKLVSDTLCVAAHRGPACVPRHGQVTVLVAAASWRRLSRRAHGEQHGAILSAFGHLLLLRTFHAAAEQEPFYLSVLELLLGLAPPLLGQPQAGLAGWSCPLAGSWTGAPGWASVLLGLAARRGWTAHGVAVWGQSDRTRQQVCPGSAKAGSTGFLRRKAPPSVLLCRSQRWLAFPGTGLPRSSDPCGALHGGPFQSAA